MTSHQPYPTRNYALGQHLLTLRSRAKLTQADLASRIGVHRRSVQKWESGETYPTAEHLRTLIGLLLDLVVFIPGQERAEATELWQRVSESAPSPFPPFDTNWFDGLLATHTAAHQDTPRVNLPLQVDPSLVQTRHDLPFQATPFIGRTAELAEIARLLSDPACRLLTLIGPGGIGKTRLALEAAAGQTHFFRNGVVFVDLSAVATPAQIVSAIGEALKLALPTRHVATPDAAERDPAAHLLDYLRSQHLLLLLDYFGHLLEGSGLVYAILDRAPSVTILITSRARLNLQAEWLFDVEGLVYPAIDAPFANAVPTLPELADYSAIQLFIQRATQVQAGLTLAEATLTTIGRICQQVAGIPLAIELAAAAVRTLPLVEIERQIRSNLDLLATSLRDVPARHRSMRAVFDHSWNLLNELERVVLSRLAIFRGGWDQAAAEAICQQVSTQLAEGHHREHILPFMSYTFSPLVLAALVDKSWVRRDASESRVLNTAVEPRFMLLEPIREYALAQLAARGEAALLRHAHATYYLSIAETTAAQWVSPTSALAIQQLDRERDNIRAALQWACDGGNGADGQAAIKIGLQLGGALIKFWRRRGTLSEGRAWLEQLLALHDDTPDAYAMAARLRAIQGAAWLASDQHDYARATALFEQSLALRHTLGETEDRTSLLVNGAVQARTVGQYPQATALLEDALAQHRALGNRGSLSSFGLGMSLFLLGLVHREQGDFARATALFEECVTLHRTLGDSEGIAASLLALSDVARDQGDVALVRTHATASLGIARALDVQWVIGFTLNNLAYAAYLAGDLTSASVLAGESVALFRTQKAEGSLAEALITLGQIWQAQGNGVAAHAALAEALHLAWTVGPRLLLAPALEALASLAAQSSAGATLTARLLATAATLRGQLGTPVWPAQRRTVEQALTTSRSRLGPAAFATAWTSAEALPVEQLLRTIPDAALFFSNVPALSMAPDESPAVVLIERSLPVEATAPPRRARVDWGLAQEVPTLYGRTAELTTLTQWVLTEQCRVVTLVGLGGIGKTSLALTFARQVAPHFALVIFRSLGEAPPLAELLDQLIYGVAIQQRDVPTHLSEKLALLIALLRQERCLLILDNLETLMQAGTTDAQYLAGYEGYGTLFKALGETAHQSCLILTSRERPRELVSLEGPRTPVRSLPIPGLPEDACRMLLADQDLIGTPETAALLARRYGGNPLALKLVAEPIRDLFSSEIGAFLIEGNLFFDSMGQLLAQQIGRTSPLEQTLLTWLAIGREPVMLDELLGALAGAPGALWARATVLAALYALWRRNLIELGQTQLTFTLQRVVLEFLTEQLVERAADEILHDRFDHLLRHALIQATAKEYVRQSQERLIATPLLARLVAACDGTELAGQRLLMSLTHWRSEARTQPVDAGYAPGNVINLLRLLRGDLRGLDLTRLTIRQVYLQGVDLHDTNLAEAVIQDSVFTEPFDDILSVAISSTGLYWAASSRRGEIRVWSPGNSTGSLLLRRVWRAHTNMIWKIAFSPDGNTLASVSWDGSVKLWEIATGELRWSGRHTQHVNNLAFSADNTLLATTGLDATVRIWELRSGAQLHLLSHPEPLFGIDWSPHEHTFATGDLKGCIRFWTIDQDVDQANPVRCTQTIQGHTQLVNNLAFAPDGRTLASAGYDGTVKLWDVATATLRAILPAQTKRVHLVNWSPDGRILVRCSQNIELRDDAQGNDHAILQGNAGEVWTVAFAPDSRTLFSAGEDGRLRIWDVETGHCVRVMQGYAAALYDVDWSPDGTQLVAGSSDRLVILHTVNGHVPPYTLRGHRGVVFGVSWGRGNTSDSQRLASSEVDDAIRLWDPSSGTCLDVLQHPADIYPFFRRLAWSPDGRRLASGAYRSGVHLFARTGEPAQWGEMPFPTLIRNVAWSPDGTTLVAGGDDGIIYLWDAADGTLVQRLAGHHSRIMCVAWSPDGTRLASGGRGQGGGELFVWDAQRGERLMALAGHAEIVTAVAWGPMDTAGRQLLVSAGGSGELRWWDLPRAQCIQVRAAHLGTVHALRRSPDGTQLASCADDGDIMLWDLASGAYRQTLRRDRPYERMNIDGVTGLTDVQRSSLKLLGAIEEKIGR